MAAHQLDACFFNDTHKEKLQEQVSTGICKKRTFAASDYCLHNQFKFWNSIAFVSPCK